MALEKSLSSRRDGGRLHTHTGGGYMCVLLPSEARSSAESEQVWRRRKDLREDSAGMDDLKDPVWLLRVGRAQLHWETLVEEACHGLESYHGLRAALLLGQGWVQKQARGRQVGLPGLWFSKTSTMK